MFLSYHLLQVTWITAWRNRVNQGQRSLFIRICFISDLEHGRPGKYKQLFHQMIKHMEGLQPTF